MSTKDVSLEYALTAALCRSGFLELIDNQMRFEQKDDLLLVSLSKKLDSLKRYSRMAGFDGLRARHVTTVTSSMGLGIRLQNDSLEVSLPLTGAEAVIVFPSLRGRLSLYHPTRPFLPERGREEEIWENQFLGLHAAHLVIHLELNRAEGEVKEVAAQAAAVVELAVGAAVDFMSSLKFFPKLKYSVRRPLRPTVDELSSLLAGGKLIDQPLDSSQAPITIGVAGGRFTLLARDQATKALIHKFLAERHITVYPDPEAGLPPASPASPASPGSNVDEQESRSERPSRR